METAKEMHDAVLSALPADVAIMAAAVADFAVANASDEKIKKAHGADMPNLEFTQNPDILAKVAGLAKGRPGLVVGFAAETTDVVAHATAKRDRKGCDWIVANDVSAETGIMGGAENAITLITDAGAEPWPRMPKGDVAQALVERLVKALA